MNGTATRNTRIYETDTGLACNIPHDILPLPTKRIWEDTSYIEPGYYKTIPGWLYVTVGAHPSTRLTLSYRPDIPPARELISRGLDPTLPVQIRPYRTTAWIRCHPLHTTKLIDEQGIYDPSGTSPLKPVYGRATFPVYYPVKFRKEWSARQKEQWIREKRGWPSLHEHIRRQDIYPFQIRGTTLPRYIKQGHWKNIRENVAVKYLDNIYPVDEYKEDAYRWNIPEHIEGYNVLQDAMNIGNPEVQFYQYGYIYANFSFPGFEDALYRKVGRCYRSTSHIKIGVVKKDKYEFKFDIRSHYLSLCPQTYYLDPNGVPLKIYQALAWTNLRLFQAHPGFANVRAGFEVGNNLIRRKWDKNKQRMVRTVIPDRPAPTLWMMGNISKDNPAGHPMDYLGIENVQISLGEGEMEFGEFYKFNYCTKEVEYDKPPAPRETYDNDRIENTMIKMGARRIFTDEFGYVWLR